MPWIMQMAGCAGVIIGTAFVVWIGFWFFAALLLVGVTVAAVRYLRVYLTVKGILNERPGVPPEEVDKPEATIIDGDYKRIDSE